MLYIFKKSYFTDCYCLSLNKRAPHASMSYFFLGPVSPPVLVAGTAFPYE